MFQWFWIIPVKETRLLFTHATKVYRQEMIARLCRLHPPPFAWRRHDKKMLQISVKPIKKKRTDEQINKWTNGKQTWKAEIVEETNWRKSGMRKKTSDGYRSSRRNLVRSDTKINRFVFPRLVSAFLQWLAKFLKFYSVEFCYFNHFINHTF